MSPKMKKSEGRKNKRAHDIDDIERANFFSENTWSTVTRAHTRVHKGWFTTDAIQRD